MRRPHEGSQIEERCSAYTCESGFDSGDCRRDIFEADPMGNVPCNGEAGAAFPRAISHRLPAVLCFAATAFSTAALSAVPAEYRGTWVPSKAGCESSVRVLIGADRLTLVNGKDTQALAGIEMAGPGYFPPDYRGIMAVLITEFSGNQPVTVLFNPGEKKGVAQAEFSPVQPGAKTAQGKQYNAHISKLNLAKRFPLDKALLKKCDAGAAAKPPSQGAQPADVRSQFAVGDVVEARYGRDWIAGRINSVRASSNAQGPAVVYEVMLENGQRGMLPERMLRKPGG
jgi:hypothetical protein